MPNRPRDETGSAPPDGAPQAQGTEPALTLEGVTVRLGGREVLRDVHLRLPLRGATFVVGPSGGGKSTLCRTAVGLLRPSAGTVRYSAGGSTVRVDRARAGALAELRRRVPFVIQAPALLDWLSLAKNVALAARAVAPAEAARRTREALEAVGIVRWGDRHPSEVSPGVLRRAVIARALALSPTAVILDEPTTGLDRAAADQVIETLRGLTARAVGVIAVSHDLRSVEALADRVVEVRDGRVRGLREDPPDPRGASDG